MTDTQRRTKTVATLGPALRDEPVLARLIESGRDEARINPSHGTTDEHAATMALLRRVTVQRGVPRAILIGLPGPTPRIGALSRPLTVRAEEIVTLGSSAAAQAPVNFPELLPHVSKGELVLVDDGAVALEALSDGTIESRKGANLPDTQLPSAAARMSSSRHAHVLLITRELRLRNLASGGPAAWSAC